MVIELGFLYSLDEVMSKFATQHEDALEATYNFLKESNRISYNELKKIQNGDRSHLINRSRKVSYLLKNIVPEIEFYNPFISAHGHKFVFNYESFNSLKKSLESLKRFVQKEIFFIKPSKVVSKLYIINGEIFNYKEVRKVERIVDELKYLNEAPVQKSRAEERRVTVIAQASPVQIREVEYFKDCFLFPIPDSEIEKLKTLLN